MVQLDLILQLQLFALGIGSAQSQHFICLHALLQILIHKVEAGLGISDLRDIGIDPVHAGQHPDSRDRKGRYAGGKLRHIPAAADIHGHKGQHAHDKHRLDQNPRHIVHHRIIPGNVRPELSGLIVISDKKLLPVQDLHILKAIGGLNAPLGDS